MTPDTDLATLRDLLGTLTAGPGGDLGIDALAALDRVETELARLREERDDFKRKWRAQPTTDWAKLALLEAKEAAERELARLRQERERIVEEAWEDRGELARLQEGLRQIVGESYNLLTQGESPTQRRQPSAQRIYDTTRALLADTAKDGQ